MRETGAAMMSNLVWILERAGLMSNLLSVLNDNAGALQSLIALMLAVITGVYVVVTHRILAATRAANEVLSKEHEANNRPYISVALYFRSQVLVCLLIKNVGKSVAENVRLRLDRDVPLFGEQARNLRDFTLFNKEMKQFLPGAEYHVDLGQSWLFFDGNEGPGRMPAEFEVTCEYSFSGKTVSENTFIDMAAYRETAAARPELIRELEKARKEITKQLEAIKKQLQKKTQDIQ